MVGTAGATYVAVDLMPNIYLREFTASDAECFVAMKRGGLLWRKQKWKPVTVLSSMA